MFRKYKSKKKRGDLENELQIKSNASDYGSDQDQSQVENSLTLESVWDQLNSVNKSQGIGEELSLEIMKRDLTKKY